MFCGEGARFVVLVHFLELKSFHLLGTFLLANTPNDSFRCGSSSGLSRLSYQIVNQNI